MRSAITVGGHTLEITDADAARFWVKVDRPGPDGCWRWMGAINPGGYGRFGLGGRSGRTVQAHRFAYVVSGSNLDPELQLDHLCHVRACVNPSHLRLVTNAENVANRAGANSNNLSSGVRGVSWHARSRRWRAEAKLNGLHYYGGLHASIEAAELAVLNLRVQLGMANAADLARITYIGAQS